MSFEEVKLLRAGQSFERSSSKAVDSLLFKRSENLEEMIFWDLISFRGDATGDSCDLGELAGLLSRLEDRRIDAGTKTDFRIEVSCLKVGIRRCWENELNFPLTWIVFPDAKVAFFAMAFS